MMTVQEIREEAVGVSTPEPSSGRRPLTVVLVGVLALVLGVLGGWVLWGGSESDPAVVVAGGGELSERQQDMVDMFYDYSEAVLANDGAAVVEMFVPDGTWSGVVSREPLSVEDGSLEQFVDRFPFSAPFYLEPILVDGEKLIYTHDYGGASFYDVVTFTLAGDVKIVDHRWMS